MEIIDGRALAEKFKDSIVEEITKLGNERPSLAIILVGDNEESKLYVGLKEKEAKKVGIDTHTYYCPSSIAEEELIKTIKFLNKDDSVDAILIQLPLPNGFDTDKIIKTMEPSKDVDGFHPDNIKKVSTSLNENILPPVLRVVLEMLKSINCEIKEKSAAIIANSDIFGDNLASALSLRGAETEVLSPDDHDIAAKTRSADILISAVGRPHFIKKEMIKEDAIIIDVGITKKDKKALGDVDFEDVKDKAGFITPVPGGVGPMTIAMAFLNTLELFKRRKNKF